MACEGFCNTIGFIIRANGEWEEKSRLVSDDSSFYYSLPSDSNAYLSPSSNWPSLISSITLVVSRYVFSRKLNSSLHELDHAR